MVARIRAVFNETGTTSGFLNDANNLYPYIDSAQNEIINTLMALQKRKRIAEPFYECELLKVIIGYKQFDILNNKTVYKFTDMGITDYKEPYDLQLINASYAYKRSAALMNLSQMHWCEKNEYQKPTLKNPAYAINNYIEIVISPAPVLDAVQTNGGEFRYYFKPLEITGGATPITIRSRCHEAMIYFSLSLAYDQDKEKELAMKYQKLFENEILQLI